MFLVFFCEITLRSETGMQGQQHQRGVQEVPKHDWSAELPDHASEVCLTRYGVFVVIGLMAFLLICFKLFRS